MTTEAEVQEQTNSLQDVRQNSDTRLAQSEGEDLLTPAVDSAMCISPLTTKKVLDGISSP